MELEPEMERPGFEMELLVPETRVQEPMASAKAHRLVQTVLEFACPRR